MKGVNHEDRKHALLSASGASRWLNCTPSARLEEKFESTTSVYAEEGTLAHEFGDIGLRFRNKEFTKRSYNSQLKKLRSNPLYTAEMEPQIEKYIDYVLEELGEARRKTKDAVLLIEEKLDFSHLVEKGFGTGDAGIIADGTLEIIDLKYGKGIKVDAEENPQLMLYGSGALSAFELMYDIHTVKLTIVQPRLNHVSSSIMTVETLRNWGENEVVPAAKKAYAGEGLQNAGSWCKWCKVKAQCATIASKNLRIAKDDFKDVEKELKSPHLLTDKQLLEVYKEGKLLIDWYNALSSHITKEALKGKHWPGYKLVEGQRTRKWVDPVKVAKALDENMYDSSSYMISKLAGIIAIEKLVGKKNFPNLLGKLVMLPPGNPSLVDEDDKRPAIGGPEQAKRDFKGI